MIDWYAAYEYDFNLGHGEVVIHKDLEPPSAGDKIILVSIEGNRRRDDYEGFGTIVEVLRVEAAFNKDYLRVITDL